jgi:hypothetical protein
LELLLQWLLLLHVLIDKRNAPILNVAPLFAWLEGTLRRTSSHAIPRNQRD